MQQRFELTLRHDIVSLSTATSRCGPRLSSATQINRYGRSRGIDAAAHCSAIASGGRTIAVIGTPLERAYPAEHAALQDRIRRDHLLVSPFPAETRTTRVHFAARNRVMARLADVTVVVEAGDNSGTMHQIEECLRAGRPVFVAGWLLRRTDLAWPRNVLERRGAFVWRHPSDIVDAILL